MPRNPPATTRSSSAMLLDGVRGLAIKVTPSGSMKWFPEFRFRGEPRKLTLGGEEMSLKLAREGAREALRRAGMGDDPTDPERRRRQSRTVADLWARFKADYLPDHESAASQATTHGIWENYILPEIGRKKLIDLTDDDIRALVRTVAISTERTARNGKVCRMGGKSVGTVLCRLRGVDPTLLPRYHAATTTPSR